LSKLPTVNFGYSDLVREKRRRVSSYGVFILSLCEDCRIVWQLRLIICKVKSL